MAPPSVEARRIESFDGKRTAHSAGRRERAPPAARGARGVRRHEAVRVLRARQHRQDDRHRHRDAPVADGDGGGALVEARPGAELEAVGRRATARVDRAGDRDGARGDRARRAARHGGREHGLRAEGAVAGRADPGGVRRPQPVVVRRVRRQPGEPHAVGDRRGARAGVARRRAEPVGRARPVLDLVGRRGAVGIDRAGDRGGVVGDLRRDGGRERRRRGIRRLRRGGGGQREDDGGGDEEAADHV